MFAAKEDEGQKLDVDVPRQTRPDGVATREELEKMSFSERKKYFSKVAETRQKLEEESMKRKQ